MINKIRGIFDQLKPQTEKGGKLEKLWTTVDALDTFLFKPNHTTRGGVHIKDGIDMKRTMFTVVIALIPCLLFGIYNTGHQHFVYLGEAMGFWDNAAEKFFYGLQKVLPVVAVAYIVGLSVEFLFATMKRHPINEGFLVSGMLIPLIMPATIPLWMVAVATVFAVIFGKEVFGGTGMNILNVALTARVFVFFAYPQDMSGDSVWVAGLADGVSGATAMAQAAATEPVQWSFWQMFVGAIPGSIGETSMIMVLIGAAILLISGVGSWKIMFTVFLGAYTMGILLNIIGAALGLPEHHFLNIPAHYQLVMGGLAFGAVYMATDPVTATQTEKGKYIYGFLIGFTAIIIRVLNPAYPEGIMLSILFFNVFAPLIDHYIIQNNIKKRLARVTN